FCSYSISLALPSIHPLFLLLLPAPPPPGISTLSLHDALPISSSAPGDRHTCLAPGTVALPGDRFRTGRPSYRTSLYTLSMAGASDRKSTRLNSSHVKISYAVFCLKKKNKNKSEITRGTAHITG